MSKINALQAAALNEGTAAKSQTSDAAATASPKKSAAKQPAKASSKTTAQAPAAKVAPGKTTAPVTVAKPAAKHAAAKKVQLAKPVAKAGSTAKSLEKALEKTPAAAKAAKEKTPKLKMERDSFTMPKTEYAQLYVLKERLIKLGQPSKKSELLRAGIMQLTAMTDAALKAAMGKVPAIKTGRPKKK